MGWPGQGPGKLARFAAWNYALSPEELTEFWSSSKPISAELGLMQSTYSIVDASTSGGAGFTDSSGTKFDSPAPQQRNGVSAWDLDNKPNSFFSRIGGHRWTVAQSYTHCAWIKWRESNSGWRTLFRGSRDHSVLVKSGSTELGMYSNRNGAWRGSGYHIVKGSFQLVCVVGSGESPTGSVGVSKFFVGSSSGSPELVGQADRVASGTKVYRLGWPGQGPGQLAHFAAWNYALSLDQLQKFWSLTKSLVTEKSASETSVLDLDASAHVGAATMSDKSGTVFNASAPVDVSGAKAWNLDASIIQRASGPQWLVDQYYTHCAWIKWRDSNSGWRTLWRGNTDHGVLVKSGGTELGMYSNRNGAFRGSGYNIVKGSFQFVCVVGSGDSPSSSVGVSKFFVGSSTKAPEFVGQADRVVSGSKVFRIGWPGQGPGKLARFIAWNFALSEEQVTSIWSHTKAAY